MNVLIKWFGHMVTKYTNNLVGGTAERLIDRHSNRVSKISK